MTTADWNAIEGSINAVDVLFARLAAANLHYGLFGELVEGFSLLPISDIPEDLVVSTHYWQYGKLLAGSHPTSDRNCYKKDSLDTDENNNGGVADDKVADNRAADNGAADDNDDQ